MFGLVAIVKAYLADSFDNKCAAKSKFSAIARDESKKDALS